MKKIVYGFGGLSYSVISQTISSFYMFFATSVLGVSGTLMGIAIAISTIWDGISDTFVGFFSDNYPLGRLGKRNGYMLIASMGMSIFNICLWCVPNTLSPGLKFLWIIVSLIILETFNTLFATPYSALGNELATSYHDRTKINASSTVFFLLGIIIPSILISIFLPSTDEFPIGQLNPRGYIKIAIVTSIISLVFGALCSIFTIPNIKENSNEHKKLKFSIKNLCKNFAKSFGNKKLNKIIFGYMFTSIATVFLCSVGLHFFTYSMFYSSNQITVLMLTLLGGTILSQPLWIYISKLKQKKPALILGIILTILGVFGIILVYIFRIEFYKFSYLFMLLLIFVCGIGSGALYTLPLSIYGDAISKINKSGSGLATYGSTLTLAGNIGNSIAQLIVGVLLDAIHFDSSLEIQSLGVQTGLALIVFVGVQASLIIGCTIFVGFKESNKV